ncbi:hypothetical protein JQ628_07830 [Bradyrhizobium lablabi]|uniref:hypothetical protein n=1 Tax=Bradyrhizobium lablabi TaxID=722472 RepID=UPI001BA5F475|nr:hypothetical protein [Bradyrhizobium lablabi]MBR1121422.1 hypothetical protein [Bradyrhizobium lablabi]
MNRFSTGRTSFSKYPDDLSEQDRRTYRRWVSGLFVFYSLAIAVAVAATFTHRPGGDETASIERGKQVTAATATSGFVTSAAAEKR